jgi:hypothetical protein
VNGFSIVKSSSFKLKFVLSRLDVLRGCELILDGLNFVVWVNTELDFFFTNLDSDLDSIVISSDNGVCFDTRGIDGLGGIQNGSSNLQGIESSINLFLFLNSILDGLNFVIRINFDCESLSGKFD